jgi:hypothetical protein
MIDWYNLAANALWIIGCAIALATLSFASFQAAMTKQKFTAHLKLPGMQIALNLAGMLFSLGLAATDDRLLVQVLWLVFAALFLFQMVAAIRLRNKNSSPDNQ